MYPISSIPYAFNKKSTGNFIHNYDTKQNQNQNQYQYQRHKQKPIEQTNIETSNLFRNYQSNRNQFFYSSLNNNSIGNNPSISYKSERSSKARTINSILSSHSNQDQFYSKHKQSNSENLTIKHNNKPLTNSRSTGALQNRIHKERRSHTMAPLSRILGPSSTPKAKLFASIIAPTDAQAIKSSQLTEDLSNIESIYHSKTDIDMTDDDIPIIVKVEYDPETGYPNEDIIRQAVNNRLNQLSNNINHQQPIVFNFRGPSIKPNVSVRVQQQQQQQQVYNKGDQSVEEHPSIRIPVFSQEKQEENYEENDFIRSKLSRSLNKYPSIHSVHNSSHPFQNNQNISSVQISKPLINRQEVQSNKMQQLPNQNIISSRANEYDKTEFDYFKTNNIKMSGQQLRISDQEILSRISYTGPPSNEIFRPSSVTDTPELSRENLLNMLNQIPDLQGRRFNIEYAASGAPEGYPIPIHLGSAANSYPEPVYIDRLPNDVIQHVRGSNNTALTAALEATIQREQYIQSSNLSQPSTSSLNYQPPTVIHHAAQPYEQVQQSRPLSTKNSHKTSEVSSSNSSSSLLSSSSSSTEDTDSEDFESVPLARSTNSIRNVGSYSSN
ncbi:unnamed protein product [Rotaria sp. Silwood2]|nr:unnamed protein product [Rotaria sp. Silwood2]CAF4577835.1 unnamed protein product [Rotaria sp. Silwood2]